MPEIRSWWEELSYHLDREQINPECADQEWHNIQNQIGPQYSLSFVPRKTLPEILIRKEKPQAVVLREEGTNGEDEARSVLDEAGFKTWDVNMDDLLKGRISLEQFQFLFAAGGFSYADVPGSAKGWASTIRFNPRLAQMFGDFYCRKNTLSLGDCNGCQLFGLLGWVPWAGIDDEKQPQFVRNISGKFESRWSTVKIYKSPSILLGGMAGSVLGVPGAHGDGRMGFPDQEIFQQVVQQGLVSLVYVDDNGDATEAYPFNPNGSPLGITGICTPDGRHLAMMPHPERAFLTWQWHYLPAWQERKWGNVSPWLRMFQNAREWCERIL
jgi:phosphoribosylformylglycinamidine synthase